MFVLILLMIKLEDRIVTFWKFLLGKSHIWEVTTWVIVTWEVALGKMPFGKVPNIILTWSRVKRYPLTWSRME